MKPKKIAVVLLVILLVILLAIILYNIYRISNVNESFQTDVDTVVYECHNWWPTQFTDGLDKGVIDGLIKPVTQYKELISNKIKEIHVFSVFHNNAMTPFVGQPNKLSIQLSGESYCDNPDNYDVNLIMEPENLEKRIITVPWAYSDLCSKNSPEKTREILTMLTRPRLQTESKQQETKKFCLFVVSNGSNHVRNTFFEKLSKYKRVDSYGKHANNMPGEEYTPEKIKEYKFMISFENKANDNYFTEKLMNAYLGDTIPIYWGCPNIDKFINPDAVQILTINESEDNNLDKAMDRLIEKIKELDQDPAKYKAAYETALFQNNTIPDTFNAEKINEKIRQIVAKK